MYSRKCFGDSEWIFEWYGIDEYTHSEGNGDNMKLIKTEDAVGQVLCHDITQIIKGVTKDAIFRKGHIITEEDIPVLLSVGKDNIYVWENDDTMLHENDAARILYSLCENKYMRGSDIKEGKIELIAECDGLLKVDREILKRVNSLGDMMIATRHGDTVVHTGDKLAGTRIIPLVIKKEKMEQANKVCEGRPILTIKPFGKKKVGIITTGNEVYHNRIQDTFTPVVIEKLEEFQAEVIYHEICDDNHERITAACMKAVEAGADVVICTGGMSVDPDDRTPLAIKNTGAEIISYGSPVLPGAMFLLAYYHKGEQVIPMVGLPGCVMYGKRTVFDIVLPRIMAEDMVTADELAALGEGGLCLSCQVCTYPNCGFGKGR
jgi:molybdenum cofactor synthesis domain-containing protein